MQGSGVCGKYLTSVWANLVFTESAPLGRISHRVAMFVASYVCAIGLIFFRGLSLALRSHDQFQALIGHRPSHIGQRAKRVLPGPVQGLLSVEGQEQITSFSLCQTDLVSTD